MRAKHLVLTVAISLSCLVSVPGCGDGAPADDTCGVVGSLVPCPCLDGGQGLQECLDDGTLGACVCPEPDGGFTDAADEDGDDGPDGEADADAGTQDGVDDAGGGVDGDAGEDAEPDTSMRVVELIGSEGGSVSLDGVDLNFGEGTVDEPIEISVTRLDIDAIDGFELFTPVYRFEPAGLTFDPPLEVRFEFEGDPSRVGVYWTNADDPGTWDRLETTVEGSVAIAQVTHFSDGFGGDEAEAACGGLPVNACGGCALLDATPDASCGD